MAKARIRDAVSLPPLVYISYSPSDEEWRARLVRFLEPASETGLIRLWHSDRLNAGDDWFARTEEAIRSATLAVVILSNHYLTSQWNMSREAPLLDELESAKKLTLLSILVQDCDWKKHGLFGQFEILSADVPLEKRSLNEQDEMLRGAAKQIVEMAAKGRPSVTTGPPAGTVDPGASVRKKGPPAGTVGPGASARNIGGPPGGTVGPGLDKPDIPGPPGATVGPEAGPPGNQPYPKNLPVDALSDFAMSTEAREVFRRAQVLATFGKDKKPPVTTSCLLFAIAESGRDESSGFPAGHFLFRQLQRADAQAYQRIFRDRFPRAVYRGTDGAINFDSTDKPAESMTPNVSNVFLWAESVAATTSRTWAKGPKSNFGPPPDRRQIDPAHILGALLSGEGTKAFERLSQIVEVTQLRTEFLKFVARSFPPDDLKAWQDALGVETSTAPEAEAPASPVPEDDFSAPLAGFAADFWKGTDLLDITRDVNALASLAAATSIEPPLSIGLFGDWGSGKSHFMREMRTRVEKLSLKARESGKPQSELGYHKRIVQIEFNAWHYIEGNLWASLVEHIFNNLRFTEEQDGQSHVKDARLAIMQKLELNQELQKKIEQRQQALQGKAEAAKQRVEDANVKRDDKWQDLTKLRQSKETAVNELPSVLLSTQQAELLKQIGLPDGALHVPAEIQKKYQQAQTFWGGIRAQWTVFRSDPKRLNKLIRILLVIGLTVLVGWFFRNVLKTAWAYAASAAMLLAGAWAAAKPYIEKFNKSMAALKEKYENVEQERQKKIITLESEVTSLTNDMAVAETEAKALDAEVAKLKIELTTADAAKLLANFIEDRAACSDYRRHLGVLALIRRDFEKLSELLSEQTTIDESPDADENTVSRIILYIDDLDRCPPKNVVQVLQAIHLLLAFRLFVVIVGVDARWVTRSLQESYEWLAADEDGAAPETKKQDDSAEHVVVTPHDYLEKIFQIPFWLKPMGDTECRNLIVGLTNSSRVANPENGGGGLPTIESSAPNATNSSSVTNRADDQQSSALMTGQPPKAEAQNQVISTGSEVQSVSAIDPEPSNLNQSLTADRSAVESKVEEKIDLAPRSLALTDVEIDYMTNLSPIIKRSPRAVKRFLNCYRLIKVNLKPNHLDAFIGSKEEPGQFTAVMVLLGVITGAPTISLPLIEELERYSYSGKRVSLNSFLQQLEQNSELVKQVDWLLVRDFLEERIGSDTEPTFESLIDITPQVSRYSFRVAKSRSTRQRPLVAKLPKTSAQAAV